MIELTINLLVENVQCFFWVLVPNIILSTDDYFKIALFYELV